MRPHPPTLRIATGLVLAVLVTAAACGDDAGSGDEQTASTAPVTATSITETEEGVEAEGSGDLEELAQTLLVQPAELGDPSYTDVGYTPGAVAAVCGGALDGLPADVLAGTALASDPLGTRVVQELRVYPTEDDAGAAFDAAAGAAGCGEGADVNADVGADRATAFVGEPNDAGTYVVALVADTVLAFHVVGTALDPLEVAAFGAGKVLAALEG